MTDPELLRTFAVEVVTRLSDAGFTALWAGGCVRDLMLGRIPKDYDVATDARPDQVRALFGPRRTIAVGESFGVIIVLGSSKAAGQIEVATFRSEGEYPDGRRPASVSFSTPEEDAHRRDFTINGMFYDPLTDSVRDYVGGERDLGQGIVRAIGRPEERMAEDKLRMLRAVRFTATLEFELDQQTGDAIRSMANQILIVSWERIAQEFRGMLVDKHRERAMRLCHELGLLDVILPELAPILEAESASSERKWWHTLHLLGNLEAPSFELAMAALLYTVPSSPGRSRRDARPGTVRGICRRLKLSNDESDRIEWLVSRQNDLLDSPSLPLAEFKRLLTHPGAAELLKLTRGLVLAEQRDTQGIDFAEDYLETVPAETLNPPHLIDGSDLQRLGLTPGPQFGRILGAVRDAQLNEQIHTRSEALELAQQHGDEC